MRALEDIIPLPPPPRTPPRVSAVLAKQLRECPPRPHHIGTAQLAKHLAARLDALPRTTPASGVASVARVLRDSLRDLAPAEAQPEMSPQLQALFAALETPDDGGP
jgi:hypothetical protein